MNIILVDMDGPIANFEKGVIDAWRGKYPHRPSLVYNKRINFWSQDEWENLGTGYANDMQRLVDAPGFFADLPIVPGVKKGIEELISLKYRVVVCSTPRPGLPHTVEDKRFYLAKHLGEDIAREAIFTQDKTGVFGNYLIDDNPEITGDHEPSWKQVLWSMPFNRNSSIEPRVYGWQEAVNYFRNRAPL